MLGTEGPGGRTLLFICHHSSTGNLVYCAMVFFRLKCRSGGKIMPLSAQVHFPPPAPPYAASISYTRTIIGPSLSFLSCVLYLPLSRNSSFFFLCFPYLAATSKFKVPCCTCITEDNTIGQVIQLLLTRALVTSQAHVSCCFTR